MVQISATTPAHAAAFALAHAVTSLAMAMHPAAFPVMFLAMMTAALAMMPMPMMVTRCCGLADQFVGHQICCRLITGSFDTCIQADAGLLQHILRPGADTAADHGIRALRLQELPERAMPLSVRADDFARRDDAILHRIDFERLALAKMLENLAVCIRDCNLHDFFRPF